jgi:hypothetical protein
MQDSRIIKERVTKDPGGPGSHLGHSQRSAYIRHARWQAWGRKIRLNTVHAPDKQNKWKSALGEN